MPDYPHIQRSKCLVTEPGLSSLPPGRSCLQLSEWLHEHWPWWQPLILHGAYAGIERSQAFSRLLYCPLQGANNGSLACNPKIGSPLCKPDSDLLFPVHLLWKDDLIFLLERMRGFFLITKHVLTQILCSYKYICEQKRQNSLKEKMFCSEIIICLDFLKYWAFISVNTWPNNYSYANSCHCDNEHLGREENGEGKKKKEEEIISNISDFLVSSHFQDCLWISPEIRSEEQTTSLKATQNKPLGYALVRVLKHQEAFKCRLSDKFRACTWSKSHQGTTYTWVGLSEKLHILICCKFLC